MNMLVEFVRQRGGLGVLGWVCCVLAIGLMRSFFPLGSMMTLTWMDVFILNGKAVSSARCFGRYMKYFPSFLLQILPFPSATILGHSL